MGFPTLSALLDETADRLASLERGRSSEIRHVVSPYRICPLGAHVDHQGGAVLGRTIDAYSVLAFVPVDDGTMRLSSLNLPGEARVRLDRATVAGHSDWRRYAAGAGAVMRERRSIRRGLAGAVRGTLPGGGLSSSASLGLAILAALAAVNETELGPAELIDMQREVENRHLGLRSGILDPATIVRARENTMLWIDTRTGGVEWVDDPRPRDAYRFLVVYSGVSRELTSSAFNYRVEECRRAAARLADLAGLGPAERLSEVPARLFRTYGARLPADLARRAEHYYGEADRVSRGRRAWARGDLAAFGGLMNDSCRSSIQCYECGTEAIRVLHEIVSSTTGVWGSRFSGGGYGGCVVGLVDSASAERAGESVLERYRAAQPETGVRAAAFLGRSESALRLLP